MDEQYDLFVSYAHADDHDGWVSGVLAAIEEEHARFTPNRLRVFVDRDEIGTMDQWEHRIRRALRGSKLMLAVLSPAYFSSAYCRKEWEHYLEREQELALAGQGVAPLYIITVPQFEDEAQAAMDRWFAEMRTRQYCDIRDWRDGGPQALQEEDVRQRLRALEQQIGRRLDRAGRAADSPTTIPPHNPTFVGRVEELRRLRESLACGNVGAITAVHGIGGIGKSALAFEYAHAFAHQYPGGRFLLGCAGVTDLRLPILGLAERIGVTLTDEERRDLDAGYARVRAALESGGACLLLLDNVDDPELLAPATRARLLPASDRVHVLVTTRLEPQRLPGLDCLALDTLPTPDAVRLLEKYRAFREEADRAAATGIAERLGGLALAVEAVAVFLWQHPGVTYEGVLARLQHEGLQGLEGIAADDLVALSRHQQAVLSLVLAPTLDSLSLAESLALTYAALLPPDCIALPWLRALVAEELPDTAAEPQPGYPDAWRDLERRLNGLRLLVPTDEPNLARMHRLLQEVVLARLKPDVESKRREALTTHSLERGEAMAEEWVDKAARWEIEPLRQHAEALMAAGDLAGAELANWAQEPLGRLGAYAVQRELLLRGVALQEDALAADHPDLAVSLSNLAAAERDLGALEEARALLQRAIAIDERGPATDDPTLADHCSSLAVVEQDLGNLHTARELLCRAIAIDEQVLPPGHVSLAIRYCNLAVVQRGLASPEAARDLLRRAIAIWERALPPEHPNLAASYSNLALVELDLSNPRSAQGLLRRAAAILEQTLADDHPHLATCYANLALAERDLGNLQEARELLGRAIAIDERAFAPGHPVLANRCGNLALVERDLGNLEEARALLRRAIAILEGALAPDHPNLALCYARLGAVERDLGNLDVARELLQRALAIQKTKLGPDHPSTRKTAELLASLPEE